MLSLTEKKQSLHPSLSPQSQENKMINLAVNLAEKQLMDGTAKSQVIVHFLKLGTEQSALEKERLRRENILLEAKTRSFDSTAHAEELYNNAIRAFKTYNGNGGEEDDQEL